MIKPLPKQQKRGFRFVDSSQISRFVGLPLLTSTMLFASTHAEANGIVTKNGNQTRGRAMTQVPAISTSSVYSGEQLRKLDPTNLLKAIMLVDPSLSSLNFNVSKGFDKESEALGLTFYGLKNTPNNPQQGTLLVVVDGHIESVERLMDFDICRIQSVAFHKDAATMAQYGLLGGYGVIEITTQAPTQDGVNLTYSFDGSFNKTNLGSFNMMNTEQKLNFEKELGLYDGNQALYEERLKAGDYDWLKMPTETTFSQQHRVSVDGGDDQMFYRGTILVAPEKSSTMKGTKDNTYGASAMFGYNTKRISLSNELRVDMENTTVSNYGDLSNWMVINPYYAPHNGRGEAYKILGEGTKTEQYSPMYEASLRSFNENKATRINNSFNLKWEVADNLSIGGLFSFTHDYNKQSQYVSPYSQIFDDYTSEDADQKGIYTIYRQTSTTYQERLFANYHITEGRHSLNCVLGLDIMSVNNKSTGYAGAGMASNNMDYISFAQRYLIGSRPVGYNIDEHTLGGYVTASYALDNRLFVDVTGRFDKSSILSPEKRTAPSYSASASYDLKKTALLSNSKLIEALSVSASYGHVAANQSNYDQTRALYYYDPSMAYLSGMGGYSYSHGLISMFRYNNYNPYLKWATNDSYTAEVSGKISVVSFSAKYYNMLLGNQIQVEYNDPAYGFNYKYINGGEVRNSGVEFTLGVDILKQADGFNLALHTSGIANRNKLVKACDYTNDLYNSTASYSGMSVGNAANGIYAIPSAGINPETGVEEFYLKNGTKSSDPSAEDRVYMGSATPKLSGNVALTGSYKNFDFGVMFNYSLGGKFVNLYEQLYVDLANGVGNLPVEGTQKWTPTNRNAKYQGVSGVSFQSSRFVYTNNIYSISNIRVGYSFPDKITEKVRMQHLRLGLTCTNPLLRSSIANMPLGYINPYSTGFIISLQAKF